MIIAWPLLELLLLIAFLLFLGLHQGWTRTIGALMIRIGKWSLFGGHPLNFLVGASEAMGRKFGELAATSEHGLVYMTKMLIGSIQWAAQTASGAAIDTFDALHRLQFYYTPWFVGVRLKPIADRIDDLSKADADLRSHSVPHAKAKAKTATHTAVKAHAKATKATAVADAIPKIKPAEWKDVKAKTKKLSWYLAYAGLLSFGLALLKRLRLSWLRCPNVGRAGRFLCKGIAPDFFESLLAGAVLVGTTISLVEFAEEMGGIVENVADGISFLVGVSESAPDLTDLIP